MIDDFENKMLNEQVPNQNSKTSQLVKTTWWNQPKGCAICLCTESVFSSSSARMLSEYHHKTIVNSRNLFVSLQMTEQRKRRQRMGFVDVQAGASGALPPSAAGGNHQIYKT